MSAKNKSRSSVSELVALLKERQSNNDTNSSSESLVDKIDKATALQDKYCERIETLRATKREIMNGSACDNAKKKKLWSVIAETTDHKTILAWKLNKNRRNCMRLWVTMKLK